jgi:6-phosphogluconolactonase
VDFFWGDERCVPPGDPESNFAMAQELFLRPLRIDASRIHRVKGEDDPDAAARDAASELCSIAPRNGQGNPVLDLVLLGMGEDGHVASLFPGESPEAIHDKRVYRAVTAVKPPPKRITLGYSTILAARQVWVMASGSGKVQALSDSTASGGDAPLARVLRLRGWTRIFTDIRAEKKS